MRRIRLPINSWVEDEWVSSRPQFCTEDATGARTIVNISCPSCGAIFYTAIFYPGTHPIPIIEKEPMEEFLIGTIWERYRLFINNEDCGVHKCGE